MADAAEVPLLSLEEQLEADFVAEMDELHEWNDSERVMPDRTLEEEEERDLCLLDEAMNEKLKDIARHNRDIIEYAKNEVKRGAMQPHWAHMWAAEQTMDLDNIHEDISKYRNDAAKRYVEITRQERAGEISEFQAEDILRDELHREKRKKIWRLTLLSIGKDYPDFSDLSTDSLNVVTDGLFPECERIRNDYRERVADLAPKQKRWVARQMEASAEETGDRSELIYFEDNVAGYWRSEY